MANSHCLDRVERIDSQFRETTSAGNIIAHSKCPREGKSTPSTRFSIYFFSQNLMATLLHLYFFNAWIPYLAAPTGLCGSEQYFDHHLKISFPRSSARGAVFSDTGHDAIHPSSYVFSNLILIHRFSSCLARASRFGCGLLFCKLSISVLFILLLARACSNLFQILRHAEWAYSCFPVVCNSLGCSIDQAHHFP